MEFGIQFFPAVGPDQKPADQYWREALELTQLAERLGFTNVRTVEHYFLSYGGYSPDPLIFLSAAAAVTRSIRLITIEMPKRANSWGKKARAKPTSRRHRCGAARVQQSAQARRPNRDSGCNFRDSAATQNGGLGFCVGR